MDGDSAMSGATLAGIITMLFVGGITAGNMWMVAVDRLSVWQRMSVVEFATDFRRTIRLVDPMMPILVIVTAAGAALVGVSAGGATSALAWCAFGCYAIVIVGSVILAEPVNTKFRRLPEGTPPERAEYYRTYWRWFHRARTVLGVAAFALSVWAVLVY